MRFFFSIIIPTLNEERNIPLLLDSLKKQTYRNFEIIIQDSGSQDRTKQIVESFRSSFPFLSFTTRPTKHVSHARNNGARLAQGSWLVFFDADVYVEPSFLSDIQNKIETEKPDMLTVWNRPAVKGLKGDLAFGLLNLSMTIFQSIKPAANGPCIIMEKNCFNRIHGFDETIFFGEDFDIVQRAWKTGAKMKVYKYPKLFVSTRRFDKEGLIVSLSKSLRAVFYQLFFGPIRKPIFHYQMGGQYYTNIKNNTAYLSKENYENKK